jgi:hypothetical protein
VGKRSGLHQQTLGLCEVKAADFGHHVDHLCQRVFSGEPCPQEMGGTSRDDLQRPQVLDSIVTRPQASYVMERQLLQISR